MSHRQKVLDAIDASPPLLTDGFQWISRLQDPECDLALAADFIRTHVGLSATLLRLANSSYFGPMRSIATIWDAILRLGTNQVFKTAMSIALSNLTRDPLLGYGLTPFDFLAHSAATALVCEALSHELKIDAPDYMFTAALLHDVGKIPIAASLKSCPYAFCELQLCAPEKLCAVERTIFGIDHAEAGALLAESWRLPTNIVDAICAHHGGQSRSAAPAAMELLRLANELAPKLLRNIDCRGAEIIAAKDFSRSMGFESRCIDRAIQSAECALSLWLDACQADSQEMTA